MNDDRLISLNAAIDLVCKEGTRLERNGTVAMAEIKQWCVDLLEALPSAQQWIPTSERLPEGICQAIVQTNGGAIHEVFYKGKNDYGHEVWMRFDGGIYWDDEVVAWMPLPEPWEGEQND